MIDRSKRLEAEIRVVRVDFAHVVDHPGKMVHLAQGIIVGHALRSLRSLIRVVDQSHRVAAAGFGGVEIGCPPLPIPPLPAIFYDHCDALLAKVRNLRVKLFRRLDLVAQHADPVSVRTQAIAPEPASAHRLNPFDFQTSNVASHLFHRCRIWLAAIRQVFVVNQSVAMNVPNSQMLPVVRHTVNVLDDPHHLGHVTENILIQRRLNSRGLLTQRAQRQRQEKRHSQ